MVGSVFPEKMSKHQMLHAHYGTFYSEEFRWHIRANELSGKDLLRHVLLHVHRGKSRCDRGVAEVWSLRCRAILSQGHL